MNVTLLSKSLYEKPLDIFSVAKTKEPRGRPHLLVAQHHLLLRNRQRL
jgi:hypothetical protein